MRSQSQSEPGLEGEKIQVRERPCLDGEKRRELRPLDSRKEANGKGRKELQPQSLSEQGDDGDDDDGKDGGGAMGLRMGWGQAA